MEHDLTDWDLFVLRHRKPLNLSIHFVSLLFFYLSPVAAWWWRNPWLLAPFFLSGLVGAFGHFVSGDGGVDLRETTSSPRVAFFYVPLLFWKLARGTYVADLRTADAKLERLRSRRSA